MSIPQKDPDNRHGVEVEPAILTNLERRTSTTHLEKQQDELSSPQEENHGGQPLGVTSTCKRKKPPIIHSVVRKRLKSRVKKPAPLDLNISKWWRRMDRENSFRLETLNQPGRIKKKMTKDWKLGYLPLWWMRMSREAKVQTEDKSMKKSMATFLLQNKIKNVKHDITKTFPDDKRTPPVEKYDDNDDVLKGCPPPLSKQNTSLAVAPTPGKGLKRTFEGQHIGSPAKISREGPSTYNEASQHTDKFSTRLLDTTLGQDYTSHERSERITSITDSDLMSSVAILVLEPVDISSEERGHATDDHSY